MKPGDLIKLRCLLLYPESPHLTQDLKILQDALFTMSYNEQVVRVVALVQYLRL